MSNAHMLTTDAASAVVEEGQGTALSDIPNDTRNDKLNDAPLLPPRAVPVWKLRPPAPAAVVDALATALSIPPLLARLLVARGYATVTDAQRFLYPRKAKQLDAPNTLIDMEPATARILQAIKDHETIFVSGDYDVDGITSTAIMTKGLRALAAAMNQSVTVAPYIPDRKAGFGLNALAVGFARTAQADLIVTVDNGTAGGPTRYAVQAARDAGIDVVVTDHHAPDAHGLPAAIAVVNPNRPDCPSRFKEVSGAVVAWKVVLGVAYASGLARDQFVPILESLLDLTALGLIADVMPLADENRYIATLGLARMGTSTHVGLQVLARMAVQGKPKGPPSTDAVIDQVRALLHAPLPRALQAWDCSMKIAPRMNAAGRLYHANFAFAAIMTDNAVDAFTRATELTRMNTERQALSEKMRGEALAMVARAGTPEGGIALAWPDWNPGIVGIEANKVGEWCHRPTFLCGGGDASTFKGSGRNIGMVNLHRVISDPRVGRHLVVGGGHEGAAGITVKRTDFAGFAADFDAVALEIGYAEAREPAIWADSLITTDECTEAAVEALTRLEPCGRGNAPPTFLLQGATVCSLKPFNHRTDGSHSITMTVTSTPTSAKLTLKWWDPTDGASGLHIGATVDVLMHQLALNIWNGRRNVEGTIMALRPSR